uniref:Pyruvate-flavodoxin oxidoreductase n=1 Tax=Cyanothece sp. (strain PCC 7425 / ATCC 29141) TaxID=395961 RepID=B8HYM5_CYAP4
MSRQFATIDGNEAVASVAYRLNEVMVIYPITPSTPMGEWADAWAAERKPNLWGTVPSVVEMQSEAGVAGAVHGSLQAGSLTTTFTASQGLLLMIPNMYKIAGELTPTVFYVAARALAAQGLSIFGDHSDVMAARATGFAILTAASVQEAHDFALIAHAATLASRIPFIHCFDGFRTSHEVSKIEILNNTDLQTLIDAELIQAFRDRRLSPDRPVLRGTAQNPDVYFQARETVNPYYAACPGIVQSMMDRFAQQVGRQYGLYEYHGDPEAERLIVLMGSGCEAVHETVDYLNRQGEKVGMVKVRLFRPFALSAFAAVIPTSVKTIAVLDRCKEPGSSGEPLYLDVVNALQESARSIKTIGGRYGLSSKEFSPAMIKGIFDHLQLEQPKNHFTIGIQDDVGYTSLDYDPNFDLEPESVVRAIFYGLGSDGTVGANKNSIKIIGEETDNYAQGYFVYDSKKSGSVTISHLRFGPQPIRSTYLINQANFVACHQFGFLERYDLLAAAVPKATFLLNAPYPAAEIWDHLPRNLQTQIVQKNLKFYVIDASKVARDSGMGGRINTVMQVCFFALSGVLPREEAIAAIKHSIEKTYGKKGKEIVQMNLKAVDQTLAHLYEVTIPDRIDSAITLKPPVPDAAPGFVREVLGKMIAGCGNELPVSALPIDGTYPTATAQWEKRNIAQEIPVWEPDLCVQCGKCVMVCPHAVIRSKVYTPDHLETAPTEFKSANARDHDWTDLKFTIQVAAEDCTGCGICVDVCPARSKSEARLKAINMQPQLPLREQERQNWDFFLDLPNPDRTHLHLNRIGQQQMQEPLFEFSGACAGCGETPYLKLVSQLFGDRMMVANATGCSSIYGGNLPTTPWSQNAEGRGPAWANSLFEDNAEFGLGFRLSIDKQAEMAATLLQQNASSIGDSLAQSILTTEQKDEADIFQQRERVAQLKQRLQSLLTRDHDSSSPDHHALASLLSLADYLVKKSVWIVGGDGWAYDIGFGGLDHILSSGRNVNILVLDTEVYSNTGGQMSKATPRGAVAKFAAQGKPAAKKDLGLIAMTYGNVYVASVAMGARDEHTLRAFLEAEAYPGPSLIIAYSHCIAHGIDMTTGMQTQKAAVESGHWLLYRYHPDRAAQGENPLMLDSRSPKLPLEQYLYRQNRYKMLTQSYPQQAKQLLQLAQEDVAHRWQMYQYLANRPFNSNGNGHH